jgi:hypothetical protein
VVGWRELEKGYERGFIDLLLGKVGSFLCVGCPMSSLLSFPLLYCFGGGTVKGGIQPNDSLSASIYITTSLASFSFSLPTRN